jgi:hypothetical protein
LSTRRHKLSELSKQFHTQEVSTCRLDKGAARFSSFDERRSMFETGALITLFLAILGCYGLQFKLLATINKNNTDTTIQLGKIYAIVNTHIANTEKHIDPEHPVVQQAVCVEVQKRNELHFETLKANQDLTLVNVAKVDVKLDKLVENIRS